jgi:CBS domain containing-hemolysin-like protein
VENEFTWGEYAVRLALVLLLVLANGFFVASEFALVGVRRSRVTTLAATGERRAKTLLRVINHLDAYISATQLGITLASLALGWVGEETLAHIFQPFFAAVLPGGAASAAAHTAAIATAFGMITFLHIVLGELAPKTLALERAEATALRVARPMELFYKVFKGPIWLLNKAGNVVVRAFGLKLSAEHAASYTEEELRYLIDVSHKGGHLNAEERELLHNVFEFAGETVRDCMIPRHLVTTAPASASLADLSDVFDESGFSRIPVVASDGSVVGVAHGKDVAKALRAGLPTTGGEVARPAMFLPTSAQLDYTLSQMKRTGNHMAIVVDEHGTFEGIATLEDVLEEIVGEIRDEFDEGLDEPIRREPDGTTLVDATLPIRVLNRRLGLSLPESPHYNTLAGFLLSRTGTLLKEGRVVAYEGARFVAEKVRGTRIVTVRIVPGARSDCC